SAGVRSREARSPARGSGLVPGPVEWISPAGGGVRVRSPRLVSFAQRACAAVMYEVEPLDRGLRVVLQSELVANEPAPPQSKDPRAAAALEAPLESEEFTNHDLRVVLAHRTRRSGLRVAAVMDHIVEAPGPVDVTAESAA